MRLFALRASRLHPVSQRENYGQRSRANRRQRRTGQALLLAVLLMIFVALVGSTFITVVALNMDATATQEERQRAASAATAGLNTVNYQINANGTDWRPEQVSIPPAPGDIDYSYYWTAQDISHGYQRITSHAFAGENYAAAGVTNGDWNHNGIFETTADDWAKLNWFKSPPPGQPIEPGYVKFPDPRLEQSTGSHVYMASVAAIQNSLDGTDKVGMLRVSIIGQSADDPNVFVKKVGYKGTSLNQGAFAWDQFFTNWNYKDNKNVSTVAQNVTTNTVTVSNTNGFAAGRLISIQSQTNPALRENALISKVTGNILTLKTNLVSTYTAGAFVRGAMPLSNGLIGSENSSTETPQFNADGDSAIDAWETTQNQYRSLGYGLMSNSDVQFVGKINYALNANALTSKFYVAGDIIPSPPSGSSATYHARFDDGLPTGPGFIIPTTYSGPLTVGNGTGQQLQVKDNPNVSQSGEISLTEATRNVQPTTPPDLNNFPRYLEMTKYTPGGIDGLGDGVYIGNSEDVEKVFEGNRPNTVKREMSVSEMQRFWQGKSIEATAGQGNANYTGATNVVGGTQLHRLSFPRIGTPVTDTYVYPLNPTATRDYSLEQRGIRGWVNTYEFVPRGAKIDVQPLQVVITLDDRSDSVPNAPDPSKSWPYTQNNNMPNCYRMTINIDPTSANFGQRAFGALGSEVLQTGTVKKFNGVIYAEGNVRIRGALGNQSLTVVSMGNIYVEGNLTQTGTGRFALIARKNITCNPTKFIANVSGSQDRDVSTQTLPITAISGNGANNTTPLVVSSLVPFRVGDYVRIGTDTLWRQVIRKTGTGLVLKPSATLTGTIKIRSVATLVASTPASNVIGVNSTSAFRYGDKIRVGDKNWVTVIGINNGSIPPTLALSANLTPAPAVGESVQILADPDFVPGAKVTALTTISTENGWPIWPDPVVPSGSVTGDHFESPEWFYRLSGPRDVLARNICFDNVSPGGPVGSGYQLSTRMIGERKEAFKLKLDPNSALSVSMLGNQRVSVSENTNSNTVISSSAPNELIFKASDSTATPLPVVGLYNFDAPVGSPPPLQPAYDLLNVDGSLAPGDNSQTMSALQAKFNNDQHFVSTTPPLDVKKWELADAYISTPTNLNMTTEEAKSVAARYFLPIGLAAGNTDDWVASRTDPKRFYLSTAARQFFGNTLDFASTSFFKFGAADSPTGSGDVATSDTTETTNNSKNFYWYLYNTGTTGTPNYERQQWLRWSSRPMPATSFSPTDNIVALTMDSAINSATGSTAPLRVAPFKLERSGFDAAENPYNPVTFTVQATMFAQEGSWFVIPIPVQHRNDVNNSGGTNVDEISIATRMRRANYRVSVQGHIVQNFPPLVLADYDSEPSSSSTTDGPAGQWADSLSYPGEVYQQSVAAGYRGRKWNTINYLPDTAQIPVDASIILPPSPDLSIAG